MTTTQQRTWARDPATGDHAEVCTWEPDEDTRLTALWLKFWRYEASHGRALSLRALCPCGLEPCQCAEDDPNEIAH